MKKQLLALGLIAQIFSGSGYAKVDLLIENTTVISPLNQHQVSIKEQHWVAVNGNRIVSIGSGTETPEAKNIIDGNGKYLIPGLMDSHTHLKTMPGLNRSNEKAPQMQQAFLARQGVNYLYYGVTQVIDPSNTQQGIDKFHNSGLTPTAFFCGAMPVYNGYNARGIAHKDLHHERPYYVAQATDPKTPVDIYNAHQAKQAVNRLVDDGAKCAKVYIEDGFGFANDIPLINNTTLKELTQHAENLHLPTMAHANATDMQVIAADSGVSIMGHGLWNWLEEQKTTREGALPAKVRAVADSIIEHDIIYQPTMNVMRSLAELMVEGHMTLADYKNVLPQWQINWYLSESGQWFAKEMYKDWEGVPIATIIERFSANLANGQRVLKYLYDRGVTILLASDTPPAPTYASQPGLATYIELQDMYKAGMDLKGILAAATINNAKAYHLEQDYGTVASGKIANLLLLNSDPLQSISAFDDINTVILQGKAIERDNLHISNLGQIAPKITDNSF
ncbi:hypothetical protein tinsulaeT_23870 [Thalassotalea insulae]|uniref:Amidohydrolase-related domain-containing protein n=1 Tax=Thalassotalea insulae TaxID=2056778 RepID=A0ABQ6GT06_9GAMM|nr:amidohydrolase family protein [Thalassotalea insulae]GLX79047.1 hypothetical protein tinsulaeT_23870 [Thalassotalea insulae]